MIAWAVQNAVVTLVLAIAVVFICRIGRLGPASRHALWLVVLIKFVTPPLVAWPWAVPVLPRVGKVQTAPRTSGSADRTPGLAKRDYIVSSEVITVSGSPADDRTRDAARLGAAQSGMDSARSREDSDRSVPSVPWQSLVYAVWLSGGLVMLGLGAIRVVRMWRRTSGARRAPDWLVQEVFEAAQRLGIRPPHVVVAADLASPLVWGCGRPTLLWPEALLPSGPSPAWRGVIVHELAHLRRWDHWTGWLELAASCLWWFDPVFWYTRSQLRENAELACDAWVVRMLPDGRRSYAEALLAVCDLNSSRPPTLPAWGVYSGPRRVLERRLTMILRERLPLRVSRGAWVSVVVLAGVALPNWYLIARAQPAGSDAAAVAPVDAAASIDSLPATTYSSQDVPAPVEAATSSARSEPATVATQPAARGDSAANAVDLLSTPQPTLDPSTDSGADPLLRPARASGEVAPPMAGGRPQQRGPEHAHVVETDSFTLMRTTYRVPPQMAGRLKRFLEESLSWPHLIEIELVEQLREAGADPFPQDADRLPQASLLRVTASPAAQEVIGKLIGLMLQSKPRGSELEPMPLSDVIGSG